MLAIKNATIYTMAGDVVEDGCILIENGKFSKVGKGLTIPEGVKTIDAGGLMLTPGLVDGHCHIGIGEEGIGFEGRDYNELSDLCAAS